MLRSLPSFFERAVEQRPSQKSAGKAIIYARISSKSQKEGLSLESQKNVCENYCEENNLEIIQTFYETASAKDFKNQKILVNIIDNYQDINLIVNDPSRFSRSVRDGVIMIDEMLKKNIVLHCASNEYIATNNTDFKQIMSGFKDAEIEIKTLSNRLKRTIRFKKENNLYLPSVAKYGRKYIKALDDDRITIQIVDDQKEKMIIELIRKMFYGSPSKDVEQLLISITGDKRHKIYDYSLDVEISEIKPGNFCKKDIAEFLNHLSIFKRGRKWSSGMISAILMSLQ